MALIAAGVIAAGGLAAEAWAQSPTVPSVNVGNLLQIIGLSPLGGCRVGGSPDSIVFPESEVEPYIDVKPTDPRNLVAVWQQDRSSDGGAGGLPSAVLSHYMGSESESRTVHPAFGIGDCPGDSSIFTRRLPIAAVADAGALQTALLAASVRKITVAFKLDPSLLGGTYGQVPWVSPRVYQGVRGQKTVEAKAGGIDSNGGGITYLVVKWIAENPTMVAVSPREAALVKITVRKPGTSKLRMVYGRLTKTLSIKAVSQSGLLQLWITQL